MNANLIINFAEAHELVRIHGSPLLCLSKQKIINAYKSLQHSLPNVTLFYTIKSNPNEIIINTLNELKSNFEAATPAEISHLLQLNISSDRILYTHPIKKLKEIASATAYGLSTFIVDNFSEIDKIANIAPYANILIRIQTSNPDAMVNLSYKFGVSPSEIMPLVEHAIKKDINIKGLCFNVGSQNLNPLAYTYAIEKCYQISEQLKKIYGLEIEILNIGGGFPISYTEELTTSIQEFCIPINTALNKYFPDIQIIAEPGRFISGNTVTLITSVTGKTIRNGVPWYYLDDGIYNSFSGRKFENCNYTLLTESDEIGQKSVLAGPTCDSADIIYEYYNLPSLDLNDIILVPSMGAYSSCSATNFNGYDKTKIICVD